MVVKVDLGACDFKFFTWYEAETRSSMDPWLLNCKWYCKNGSFITNARKLLILNLGMF